MIKTRIKSRTVKQVIEQLLGSVLSELTVNATLRMLSTMTETDINELSEDERAECLSLVRVTLNLYIVDKVQIGQLMDTLKRIFQTNN